MATGETIGMQIARAQAGDPGDPSDPSDPSAMNDLLSLRHTWRRSSALSSVSRSQTQVETKRRNNDNQQT